MGTELCRPKFISAASWLHLIYLNLPMLLNKIHFLDFFCLFWCYTWWCSGLKDHFQQGQGTKLQSTLWKAITLATVLFFWPWLLDLFGLHYYYRTSPRLTKILIRLQEATVVKTRTLVGSIFLTPLYRCRTCPFILQTTWWMFMDVMKSCACL